MASMSSTPVGEGAVSDVIVSAEVLRRLADMVQVGECVTFPNGITIDKRPVAWPTYTTYTPNYSPPSNPSGSYQCGNCKAWVWPNTAHYCTGWKAEAI